MNAYDLACYAGLALLLVTFALFTFVGIVYV